MPALLPLYSPVTAVFHPLGDVDGVVPDALEILGDHQNIQCLPAPEAGSLRSSSTSSSFTLHEQLVHHVVLVDDRLRQASHHRCNVGVNGAV